LRGSGFYGCIACFEGTGKDGGQDAGEGGGGDADGFFDVVEDFEAFVPDLGEVFFVLGGVSK
jgi:hypothetical protein